MTNVSYGIEIAKLKTVSQLNGRIRNFFTDAEIIEFAKNYDCPHYVLTHPITKQETYLFIHTEVDQWFVNRYLQKNHCIVPQVIYVNNFNYQECKVKPFHRVPKELIEMEDLYHLPSYMADTPPGIYFLCRETEIVYVGQSRNAGKRAQHHRNEKDKQFDTVYFFPCHITNLDAVENALIRILQPHYNSFIAKCNSKEEDEKILEMLKFRA